MSAARATKFINKYIKNGYNSTRAVLELGWTDNHGSAAVIGHRLLKSANAIRALERHNMDDKLSAEETLANISKIARTPAEFKGTDVLKANEIMAKHHKLITEKVESDITVRAPLPQLESLLSRALDSDSTPEPQNDRVN